MDESGRDNVAQRIWIAGIRDGSYMPSTLTAKVFDFITKCGILVDEEKDRRFNEDMQQGAINCHEWSSDTERGWYSE